MSPDWPMLPSVPTLARPHSPTPVHGGHDVGSPSWGPYAWCPQPHMVEAWAPPPPHSGLCLRPPECMSSPKSSPCSLEIVSVPTSGTGHECRLLGPSGTEAGPGRVRGDCGQGVARDRVQSRPQWKPPAGGLSCHPYELLFALFPVPLPCVVAPRSHCVGARLTCLHPVLGFCCCSWLWPLVPVAPVWGHHWGIV